ncbi:MAG: hypothetical protein HY343_08085 [Lentisphaerae bacterium]|nr:hypothetical protein [Lentisphaerota bacterium]
MKLEFHEPFLRLSRASSLRLSNAALIDLMRAVLSRNARFRFCASGSSMEPCIRNGDILCMEACPSQCLRTGNVVAFVHPTHGLLTVHRLICRQPDGWLIRGDNSPGAEDGIIPADRILGRVCSIERHGTVRSWGLGPERYLIARFSNWAWLHRLIQRRDRLCLCLRRNPLTPSP